MYICTVIAFAESPLGGKRAWHIHIKRRNWTLWFWRTWISQVQTVSQKQSNGDAPWDVYIQPALVVGVNHHGPAGWNIYSSAWGFQRCSFRLTGQCESPGTWNEHQTDSTFFVCMYENLLTGFVNLGPIDGKSFLILHILWKSNSFSLLPLCWHLHHC